MLNQIDILEDFAGPGGWDEGARIAGSTATVVGREINADAVATAEAAGHTRKHVSVLDDDPAQYRGVKGYIASPPCQTFSTAGKGAGRAAIEHLKAAAYLVADGKLPKDAIAEVLWGTGSNELDERSVLVLEPLRVILETSPLWIAMEQVPNALPVFEVIAEILRERFGYHVRTGIVSAEEYGVPQTRRRAILTAVDTTLADEAPWPTKTHSKYHVRTPERLDEGFPRWVSMAEALGWEPDELVGFPRKADSDDTVEIDGEQYRARDLRTTDAPSQAVSGKARSWKRYYYNGNQAHSAIRPVEAPAPTVHFGARVNTVTWQASGDIDPRDIKVATHMGDVVRANGTVRDVDQPSATITGALDNGNFRWVDVNVDRFNDQSGTAFDPLWPGKRPATAVAGRGLVQNPGATANRHNGSTKSRNDGVKVTVEEAGVLQSFPADYPWQGSMTSRFQRVGDAVPPVLAAAVLAPLLALTGHLETRVDEVA